MATRGDALPFEHLIRVLTDDELVAFGFLVPKLTDDEGSFSFADIPTAEIDALTSPALA